SPQHRQSYDRFSDLQHLHQPERPQSSAFGSLAAVAELGSLGGGQLAAVRIWSLHPKYLDARGLVALWREGLLAQAVLKGETTGYVYHPQLLRFREQSFPVAFIAEYLRVVHGEAVNRGYCFAAEKISRSR